MFKKGKWMRKKKEKRGGKLDLNVFKIVGIIYVCLKINFDSLCLKF